jgi:hypothetical protein
MISYYNIETEKILNENIKNYIDQQFNIDSVFEIEYYLKKNMSLHRFIIKYKDVNDVNYKNNNYLKIVHTTDKIIQFLIKFDIEMYDRHLTNIVNKYKNIKNFLKNMSFVMKINTNGDKFMDDIEKSIKEEIIIPKEEQNNI